MAFPRKLIRYDVAVLVLAAMGAGIYLRIQEQDESESSSSGNGERPVVASADAFSTDMAIPVEGAPVIRDTLVLSVTAAGQAAAYRQATLLAQVEGQVKAVRVRENARVGAGELLLEVDATQFELAVERARAQVASAEAQFRELTVFDDWFADPAVREERERSVRARSQLDQARVSLKEAELQLARTRVRAPFPGRVASVKVVPGQWVRPSDELMTVVDLDPIKVEVQVLEGQIGFLTPGRKATISFAAFPDTTFTGTIETINPIVDHMKRMAQVTVTVPNPEGKILP